MPFVKEQIKGSSLCVCVCVCVCLSLFLFFIFVSFLGGWGVGAQSFFLSAFSELVCV